MPDVPCAFVGREVVKEGANGRPEGLEGAGGGFSEQGLELGEDLLDGVEVRAVGRQVAQLSAGRFDGRLDAGDLVRAQVVHDHDVVSWSSLFGHSDREFL